MSGQEYYQDPQTGALTRKHPGISLRDYFATAALTGIISTPNPFKNHETGEMIDQKNDQASIAYEYADAMIAARGSK